MEIYGAKLTESVSRACTAISIAISVARRPNRVENLMIGFRLTEEEYP